MNPMRRVFLGGTCNESSWRDTLIPLLTVSYFNPVVEDWTEDCIKLENMEKNERCDVHLYVITKEMTGVYSIAEAVQSSHNRNVHTVFQVIPDGFDNGQLKSLYATLKLIADNGATVHYGSDLNFTAQILNEL